MTRTLLMNMKETQARVFIPHPVRVFIPHPVFFFLFLIMASSFGTGKECSLCWHSWQTPSALARSAVFAGIHKIAVNPCLRQPGCVQTLRKDDTHKSRSVNKFALTPITVFLGVVVDIASSRHFAWTTRKYKIRMFSFHYCFWTFTFMIAAGAGTYARKTP